MHLIDDVQQPGGYERETNRYVWRVYVGPGDIRWGYIEVHNEQILVTGYARYPVEIFPNNRSSKSGNEAATVATGAVGAALGGAIGGPPGAIIGGLLGLILGASSNSQRRLSWNCFGSSIRRTLFYFIVE